MSDLHWTWMGRLPFEEAAALQEQVRLQFLEGSGPQRLICCEHPPVLSLGRSALPTNVLATSEVLEKAGIERVQASRGGDVTYHGPGQLVVYPVVQIGRRVRAHVEAMAFAIVDLLAALGVKAQWQPDRPGVWVGSSKICAFGVNVRRGVAIHGLALNVNPELGHFGFIVPCGLQDASVTSLMALGVSSPSLSELAALFATQFALRTGRDLREDCNFTLKSSKMTSPS